jgi:hypothetical protein
MALEHKARQDFDWALFKAFWRKVITQMVGGSNELLPFDEVRARLPLKGQRSLGFQQVPIDKIIGSQGRYHDFDRAFLPRQTHTKDRWISISTARYQHVALPPVDLYKMGEVYFVRDGNHRVSVARERGQKYVDAYVTEIDIPVTLTPDVVVDDLELKQAHATFLEESGLANKRPDIQLEVTFPEYYERLLEHIATHRWYLGEQRGVEVPLTEAAVSWYENVYQPLVKVLREQEIIKSFRNLTETDLYIWIIEYQWYFRKARDDESVDELVQRFTEEHPYRPVAKLVAALRKQDWIDDLTLQQERLAFLERTQLNILRPEAVVEPTLPGEYAWLLEHIDAHRWYLGERLGGEVPYDEAVTSWYDQAYLPLVDIIREQEILTRFPGRSEADLYLWVIAHQWYLRELLGDEIPLEQAAEALVDKKAQKKGKKRSNRSNIK